MLLFATDSLDYVDGLARRGAGSARSRWWCPTSTSRASCSTSSTDTGGRLLFIDAEQVPKLVEVAAELPASLQTIVVRGDAVEVARRCPRQSVIDACRPRSQPTRRRATPYRRHSNELAYMFYSGGTTGTAKGITHLAYDFLLVPARHGAMWEYSADDVVYATSKKYFTHGIWPGLLIPLAFGATLCSTAARPRPTW